MSAKNKKNSFSAGQIISIIIAAVATLLLLHPSWLPLSARTVSKIEELEQKYETLSAEFFRFKYDKLTPVELDDLMAVVNGGT